MDEQLKQMNSSILLNDTCELIYKMERDSLNRKYAYGYQRGKMGKDNGRIYCIA